jgi:hypothetical protein
MVVSLATRRLDASSIFCNAVRMIKRQLIMVQRWQA